MVETLHGIIIQVIPYRDQDAIITLLNPLKGLVSFKARGVGKITSKNSPSCQLFSEGEYVVDFAQEDGHRTLRTAELVYYPKIVLESIQASSIFQLLAEGIIKLDLDRFEEAYFSLYFLLHHFHEKTHGLTVALIILGQFLHWSGSAIEMDRCVNCGTQKQIVAVSMSEGGLLCHSCQTELGSPLDSPEYIRNFRLVMRATVDKNELFKVDPSHGFRMMNALFEHLKEMVGIDFKSQEVLKQIL